MSSQFNRAHACMQSKLFKCQPLPPGVTGKKLHPRPSNSRRSVGIPWEPHDLRSWFAPGRL